NSTIDIQNLASAAVGTLSIGGNKLSLTGITGASLATGAVTLTGNPTFDAAPNTTLSLGALADGNSARAITKTGLGTLAFSAAAAGAITVEPGATLAGTGSVGAIVSNGIVAPGGAVTAGKLTAAAATFNNGSTLKIRVPSIVTNAFDLLSMGAGTGTNLAING